MTILIRGGLLLDGTGREPLNGGAVLIEADRIASVGVERQVSAPPGAEVIDAEGALITPGMFNLHEHISRKILRRLQPGVSFREQGAKLMAQPFEYLMLHSARNALDEVQSGVTTIRNFGIPGNTDIILRRAINEGLITGPRVLASGKPICMTGGHAHQYSHEADGPNEVRKAVREQIKAGADLVKFMASGGLVAFPDEDPDIPELNLDELEAGIFEAHKFHRPCAAHAYATSGIKNVVRAGIDSVEHGVFLDEEAIHMMVAQRVSLVPTMSGLSHVPQQVTSTELGAEITERVLGPHKTAVKAAWEAGVKIGIGTDSLGEVVQEMELLHAATSITPQQCLEAATRVSAEIAGLADRLGTLEPGKLADIVLMEPAALDDIGEARNVRLVLKEGKSVTDARI